VKDVEEVQRKIALGLSDRDIALAHRCRRSSVSEIRALGTDAVQVLRMGPPSDVPAWAEGVAWQAVLDEIGRGFAIKSIWEERAGALTGYQNFWKYLYRHYPAIMRTSVTPREFAPGSYCEVDWAGGYVLWFDGRNRAHKASIFLGILCHSQLIFSQACENQKILQWLNSHEKMYKYFGGVPTVTVPDNLRTGVSKVHRYDPDLQQNYADLAAHYGTAIVPARPRRPKDKALVENAVGLVMRYFYFINRDKKFHSLEEINYSLREVIDKINARKHTRLKVSRRDRFEMNEKSALKVLPDTAFELTEWHTCRLHPDSSISLDSATYTAPFIHRGRELRVKASLRQIEIFYGSERIAVWARDRSRRGLRHIDPAHLPLNSQAYLEAVPQNILSQARFLSQHLHDFINDLFNDDTLGNLRRAQGFVRIARTEIKQCGNADATTRIIKVIEEMRRYNKSRTPFFKERLEYLRKCQWQEKIKERDIERKPGNPMLRHNTPAEEQEKHGQQYAHSLEGEQINGTGTNEIIDGGVEAFGHGDAVRKTSH
jgi:hypothetical protein